MPHFIGKEIEVQLAGEVRDPVSFRFADKEYRIVEVLERWHDYGFSGDPARKRRWWMRHHVTCYRVRTAEGEVFELQHERGTHPEQAQKGKWYLYRQQ